MVLLVSSALPNASSEAQEKRPESVNVTLVGRVLASVNNMVVGAGVGPQYEIFVFGVESQNESGQQVIVPVKVAYVFLSRPGACQRAFSITRSATNYESSVMRGVTKL
jgi:hypothetical protein